MGFFLLALIIISIGLLLTFIKSEITIGILGFTTAIVTASIQYRAAKDKESTSRLFSEKQKVYNELMEMIMRLFAGTKDPEHQYSEGELTLKALEVKSKLLTWASFETFTAFDKIGDRIPDNAHDAYHLVLLANVIKSMRKDLGHKDQENASNIIALSFLTPEARAEIEPLLKSNINTTPPQT